MIRRKKLLLLLLVLASVSVLVLGSLPASGGQVPQPVVSLPEARTMLERELLPLAGAGFAGIAYSEEWGEVIVFVEDEQARRTVPSTFAGYIVRTEVTGRIEALSTQVVEPVVGVSEDRQGKVRPLVGGTSASAYVAQAGLLYLYAGTLGMVTYDGKILSNAHVIAMEPRTDRFVDAGTPIVQPGTGDRGRLGSRVGELEAYIPIDFAADARNYADAAIASIDDGIEVSPGEQFSEEGNYWIGGWTTVSRGDTVRKSGRTTGVTSGQVTNANASFLVWYGDQSAYFADQIVVPQQDWSFAGAGDSGSAVDRDGEFVGLVFAGSETHAVISKAEHIIAGLGVVLQPEEIVRYLTVSSTAGGSVTGPGEGVFQFEDEAVVTLVAEPVQGYQFVQWSGDVGTIGDDEAAQTTITMDASYTVVADFEPLPGLYGLVVSSTPGGTVTQPGTGVFTYETDAVVDLVAQPEEGYRFVEWTGDVASIGDVQAAETTITMSDTYSITAEFDLIIGVHMLTISSTGGGSVARPGEGTFVITSGAVVALVAEPDEGYQFVTWVGDVDTIVDVRSAQTTLTMRDSYSIVASFETWLEPVAVLTIYSTEGGSVITPGEGEFLSALGSEVSLVAAPEKGYRFVGWTGDVETIADATATSTTIVADSSYSVVANFERSSSGCCAATAAYDRPMAEELVILRVFRDEYLITNRAGQTFTDFYYRISPRIAELITAHPVLKPMVRAVLLPAVAMSALVVNTTLPGKMAVVSLGALLVLALIVWAVRGWTRPA
jgi:hypothetical protein